MSIARTPVFVLVWAAMSAGATITRSTIDHVPADFPVGFCLLAHGKHLYAAYYNAERRMTVASRKMGSDSWTYATLPSRVGWDSHNYITMAVDKDGHLHLSGNMHCVPLIYFCSEKPGDITSFQKQTMTGRNEKRATYPRFLTDAEGELIFNYRDGGSGRGVRIYNKYARDSRSWSRLLDTPLLDGEGKRNAYPLGPVRGPDGMFHLVWVWRDTPDCATNHDLSYARSPNLITWETAGGEKIQLPITLSTPSIIIDPIPSHGGIINGGERLSFDAERRPIVNYHKNDEQGHMQLYATRFENGKWVRRQLSNWDKRVVFGGRGSMPFIGIRNSSLEPVEPGILALTYRHKDYGTGQLVIDEETLLPIERKVTIPPRYPKELNKLGSGFPGMAIRREGPAVHGGVTYLLQWETLGSNHDRPRTGKIPKSSPLELIEIRE